MNHTVSVAGHVFSFELPDRHPLEEGYLPGYTPFYADARPSFSLAFEKDPAPFTEQGTRVGRMADGTLCISLAPDSSEAAVARLLFPAGFQRSILQMEKRWSESLPACRFALDTALMTHFTFYAAEHDTLLLHASAIIHRGGAYAFLGKSGTGKSTHSRLWLTHIPETELLNDDNPALRVSPEGTGTLYGTPWSGKTRCYKNLSAPLKALVRLRQHGQNHMEALDPVESFLAVSSSISAFHLRTEEPVEEVEAIKQKIHGTLAVAIKATPVYRLDCLPDKDAAILCRDTIVR